MRSGSSGSAGSSTDEGARSESPRTPTRHTAAAAHDRAVTTLRRNRVDLHSPHDCAPTASCRRSSCTRRCATTACTSWRSPTTTAWRVTARLRDAGLTGAGALDADPSPGPRLIAGVEINTIARRPAREARSRQRTATSCTSSATAWTSTIRRSRRPWQRQRDGRRERIARTWNGSPISVCRSRSAGSGRRRSTRWAARTSPGHSSGPGYAESVDDAFARYLNRGSRRTCRASGSGLRRRSGPSGPPAGSPPLRTHPARPIGPN